jgi:hypothetical protein
MRGRHRRQATAIWGVMGLHMEAVEENQARLRSNIVVLNPALVARRLEQALESLLQDHPHIPLEQALAMWKEAGGC